MLAGDQGGQRFEHVERKLETVAFLRVYRQVDVGAAARSHKPHTRGTSSGITRACCASS